jgi:PPOX class probable F420-dependent enzyme
VVDDLPRWAQSILVAERVGRLGLVDDHDRPRVLPVTFVLHEGALYSAVDEKPKRPGELARIRFLRRRPEAALTVDRYDDDWSKLAWVQVLGRVEILETAADPAAVEALRNKYAVYRERSPGGPLLRLAVERAICWRASG